jgi:hypothetical protein
MWNSKIRDTRNAANPLVQQILRDLEAGSVTPALTIAEAEIRYGGFRSEELDPHACVGHTFSALASETGSVLVITDTECSLIYGQVADPGLEIENIEMAKAFGSLAFLLSRSNAVEACSRTARVALKRGTEFPIFSMPAHRYTAADAEAVGRYGRYGRYVASYTAASVSQRLDGKPRVV